VSVDDVFYDGKPEPRSPNSAFPVVDTLELLENLL
jgi:hypothetical protein